MSQWKGSVLSFAIEGKSHDAFIEGVLTGAPAGILIDKEALAAFMTRRAPGQNAWSTPRKEADNVEIIGGIDADGLTTGEVFAVRIANTNTRSHDYEEQNIPRPGHADYAYFASNGHKIEPGGGAFSGRLTAPLCALGFIALSELAKRGIEVHAEIIQIHTLHCETSEITPEIEAEIMAAKRLNDSVGGKVRVSAVGVPAGIGGPYFEASAA